jgi:3-carboxy-cis,cis-muconate cycloisomerase
MAAFEGGGGGGPTLTEALLAQQDVARELTRDELGGLLDPRSYTGLAAAFVDRVLALEPD